MLSEFEDYYVFAHNPDVGPDIEVDSSEGMAAVEKATGKCFNFVSVIPKLVKEIRRLDVS